MNKTGLVISSLVGLSIIVTGCGNSGGSNTGNGTATTSKKTIKLQFLQNKPEVVNQWNTMITAFEQKNPNIKVTQVNPPNTDTTLQSDEAKGTMPDVVAMGADATFIKFAKNGAFKDLSGTSAISDVSSTYVKMLEKEVGKSTPYAVPYTVNAVPIIYNKALFKKYKLKVPTTWNQLMAEAKKIKGAGGTPFYNGFKAAWTIAPIWNALTTNTEGVASFQKALTKGTANFTKSDVTAYKRMLQFVSYGQPNQFGVDYNNANTGFAKGKSVFYAQGTWTLPVIRKQNPNIKLGTFVIPTTNNPSQTKMVSGVDSLLAVTNSNNKAKEAAAMKFVNFLLQKSYAGKYADVAGVFSTVKGVKPSDPALKPLQPYIDKGKIVDFDDHYYPAAMAAGNQYESLLQGALSKKQPASKALAKMQSMYKQALSH